MKTIKVRIPVVGNARTGDYVAIQDTTNVASEKALVNEGVDRISYVGKALGGKAGEIGQAELFVSWVEAEVPVPESHQDLDK